MGESGAPAAGFHARQFRSMDLGVLPDTQRPGIRNLYAVDGDEDGFKMARNISFSQTPN
jgi:hypothetical protein